jgi:L-amino acid N-acyltransferase YncA
MFLRCAIFNEVLRNSNSIYREEEVTLEERYAWFDEKVQIMVIQYSVLMKVKG